ncbi:anti-phage protein KwaB [Clostridium sp. BSD9I1]|uniref:anti-phage protein KwaB n=1 Tax=Clostridium sp. BSD9I1 TaxID=2003589 RepID=UPI001648A82B|nr:anti-phage protein KwaB [Clostridium sp. BSD9I1]
MTKTELKEKLEILLENEETLLAEVYFILKHNGDTDLRLVDIDEESQNELTMQFINTIRQDIINDDELDVISISSADDRTKVLYEYDLEEIPQELTAMDEILKDEDLPEFSFKCDKLDDIRGILILIENKGQSLVIYKQHYPIFLYKKDNTFNLRRLGDSKRFTRLNDDFIKINPSFEFFKFNGTLFIKKLETLEKFFGFHKVIQQKAKSCLKLIEAAGILENPAELNIMIDDISFARKLTKVSISSPVLGKVSSNTIVTFSNTHPALKGKFKYNTKANKILLDTKSSKKLFVKLLNDDYLLSELTQLYYDSLAKDNIKTF